MRYVLPTICPMLVTVFLATGLRAGPTVPSPTRRVPDSLLNTSYPWDTIQNAPLEAALTGEPTPSGPDSALVRQAMQWLQRKQIVKAEEQVHEILTTPGISCADLAWLASVCREQDQLPWAMRLCQRGLELEARSPRLLLETGRIWMAVGRYDAALPLFEEAQRKRSSRDPLDERLLNEALVNALFKLQRYEAAGAIITDPEKPVYPSRANTVARVCYHTEQGDYEQALQGLSDFPTDTLPMGLIAAQIRLLTGNVARVRTDLDALLCAHPDSHNLSLHAALAALLDNDLDSAETSLNPLQTDQGIPAQLSLLFMVLRMAQGDIRAARSALATGPMPLYEWSALHTIEGHLQNRKLAIPLAYTHFCLVQGFPRQAEEAIETAYLADANNVFVQWLRAETQGHLGNHLKAARILEQAETQLPMSQTLPFLRARALEKAGDIPAAKALFAHILTLRPDFVDAALAYGRILEREENPDACLPIYATTLNYLPKSLPLLKAYAWALLHIRDFAGFQPIFERLQSHAQMRPAALLHLQGWLSHQQGDFPRAVQQLQEALDHAPGDPEICYHLGMAQWANGHPDTAHQLLTYAMYFDKTRAKHGPQVARIMAPDRR